MPVQIPDHAHCVVCGRAVAPKTKACGNECEGQLDELNKRRRRMMWMLYGLLALAMVVMFLPLFKR